MAKARKRTIYRVLSDIYYKIEPDGSFISAQNNSLFAKSEIKKHRLDKLDKEMKHCLKKEFTMAYRQARKEIRL